MTEPETTPDPRDSGQLDAGSPESGIDPLEADPPDIDPLEADPPEIDPPEADPPEADPPEIDPPEADPPEANPPEADPLEIGSDIGWPDSDAETATRAQLLATGVGLPALGKLGELAIWLSGVQGVSPPREPQRPRLIVFADPAAGAVEPAAPAVDRDGASPAAVFAAVAEVALRVVAVDGAPGSDPGAATRAAIETGIRVADEEIDAGADLLAVGALGSASATAAAIVVSVMTLVEPIKVVGPSSPLGDHAWMQEVARIRDTRVRAMPHRHHVEALLATVGGADLAAITGFLMRAAIRRTPVILDTKVVGAAALLVREMSPNAVRWWQSGDRGTDPANLLALAEFGAIPLLDLDLEVGDGVGAVLAVPLLRAAARAANDLSAIESDTAQAGREPGTEPETGPETGPRTDP